MRLLDWLSESQLFVIVNFSFVGGLKPSDFRDSMITSVIAKAAGDSGLCYSYVGYYREKVIASLCRNMVYIKLV